MTDTRPNQHTATEQPKPANDSHAERAMKRTAATVSSVLAPVSIPFLSFIILFLFSYLRIMPLFYKLIVLGIVFSFTIVLPTLTTFVFRKFNGLTTADMAERHYRYVPFLLNIVSYVFCLVMMRRLHIPWYMAGIILTMLLTMIVGILVNLRWKLSEHMAGCGAVVGGLMAFSALFGYNPVWWLCLFILISGVLGTARLMLSRHSLGEVLAGFAVGLACAFFVLHPAWNSVCRPLLF